MYHKKKEIKIGVKLFFAGATSKFAELLKEQGVKNVLESYYYCKSKKPLTLDWANLLLDSGGYTARIQNKNIDVKEYANYLNEHKIKLAFNLDTSDVEETLKNQSYLVKNTQTQIIPVYHDNEYYSQKYRELIQDYIRDFEYIALGGVANSNLVRSEKEDLASYVFKYARDKVKVHGLGATSSFFLNNYPWYSVDSTTYKFMERKGRELE